MYKKTGIFSIIFAVISIVLYLCITFQTIGSIDYDELLFLLYPAEAFLVLSIFFGILTLLLKNDKLEEYTGKIIAIISTVSVVTACLAFSVYGYKTLYTWYTPENFFSENPDYVQKIYPYTDYEYSEKKNSEFGIHNDFNMNHIPGTTYIDVYSSGKYRYNIEYFESVSPFMNLKFKLSRAIPTPFNDMEVPVIGPAQETTVDGVKLTIFANDSSYAVLITSFNKNCFAVLENVNPDEMSAEEFARDTIKQMALFEDAVKNKYFLDYDYSHSE